MNTHIYIRHYDVFGGILKLYDAMTSRSTIIVLT
jgi:hypothetical protein